MTERNRELNTVVCSRKRSVLESHHSGSSQRRLLSFSPLTVNTNILVSSQQLTTAGRESCRTATICHSSKVHNQARIEHCDNSVV